ncbi:Exosome complex exonuclease RRP4 [Tieghemostelium lacteum]|uniref:Exosome complex exonuclease RRP4 n=1 Tax=Tieghemostelium lacteum TaxID=361077 RepID=A0A151ZFE5_TIELA|nr:Exosome complex exonuclease RRP4 [Tieghemostelium lacteum]|eukprot:KYQ92590.1 Exosome complex exonuclease RRP4 [Tieghemostelium lacteum]
MNETNNPISEINIEIFSPQKRLKLRHIEKKNENEMEVDTDQDEIYKSRRLMIPGQSIAKEGEYLKGHGTFHFDGNLIASVCGNIERVNKLVSVRAFKSRYNGEIGDIIVGRITEIQGKRWKVDVNARQDYFLMLSAINLPGGIQRRRTSSDELQMRNLFVENDLVYAEVQQIMGDGSVAIHTRNLKYGKLQNGCFLKVPSNLMKRSKMHFHSLDECGVDVILGLNGYIWIADTEQQRKQQAFIQKHERENFDQPLVLPEDHKEITKESRERIARIKNSISLLAEGFMVIHPKSIMQVYKQSIKMALSAKDLLHPEYIRQITTYLSTLPLENDSNLDMHEYPEEQ